MDLRDIQEVELFKLIRAAKNTNFGQRHSFEELQRYEDFEDAVPLSFYEDIKGDIDRIKKKEADIFWPGTVRQFAVSAGTSGQGKHLPLSPSRLKADRRFMRKVALSYFRQRPNIFRLWGKHMSLPGDMEKKGDYEIGEISAFSARNAPWWLRPFQLISSDRLTQMSFKEKIGKLVDVSIGRDVRLITSAPSWLLTLFQKIIEQTGASSISDIWPRLRLIICGGVKLDNYRPHLESLIQNDEVDFMETYGASEGYFSYTDDLNRRDMKLVVDNGIFYEFIPDPLPDRDSLAIQQAVPIWEVETDRPYAMLVSTNAGLWRYPLNDIISFTQTNPPRIEVLGRVSEMLDDYGEALYSYEAGEALSEAADRLEIEIGTYTIGAAMAEDSGSPKHYWFVHTPHPIHRDTLDRLAGEVDRLLCESNRHYAIRRESDALDRPAFHSISQQQINNWLEENDKQKAQGKLPSILREEEDIRFFS